jgi:DNA-binding SARP family transcriptional activator
MDIPDIAVGASPILDRAANPVTLRERVFALDRHVRDLSTLLVQFGTELQQLQSATDDANLASPSKVSGVEAGERWCTLRLLGPVVVTCGGTPVDLSRRGKVEAVLKALALARDRRVPAALLAEWMWPELDGHEARHSLQTTVSALRRCVQRMTGGRDLVRFAGDAYILDQDVATDVEQFDRGYALALVLERGGQADLALQTLVSALTLYRDDLAIDEFEDLRFLIERERLSGIHLTILAKVSAILFRAERWEESIAFASQLLARDPSREDAHRLIIRSYLNLGQRSQALRRYELCERIIRQHFDSAIEPETAALRAKLLP